MHGSVEMRPSEQARALSKALGSPVPRTPPPRTCPRSAPHPPCRPSPLGLSEPVSKTRGACPHAPALQSLPAPVLRQCARYCLRERRSAGSPLPLCRPLCPPRLLLCPLGLRGGGWELGDRASNVLQHSRSEGKASPSVDRGDSLGDPPPPSKAGPHLPPVLGEAPNAWHTWAGV